MNEQSEKNTGYFVHVTISLLALGLMVFDLMNPGKVTQTTIELLLVAMVPWAASLFKSVELPGGLKLAFNNDLEVKAREAQLLDSNTEQDVSSLLMNVPASAADKAEIRKIGQQIKNMLEISPATETSTGNTQDVVKANNLSDKEEPVLQELLNVYREVSQNKTIRRKTAKIFKSVGTKLLESLSKTAGQPF